MPQRSQRGERPTGMSSAGFSCLEFGIWSAGHRQGFVLHCQRWRLSSCGVASLFLLNLGVVGHWGDIALDLQYRDFIHNPKSLCTVPFTESQPALYYWKICSRDFFPQGLSLQIPFPPSVSPLLVETGRTHKIWTWTGNRYPEGKGSVIRKWCRNLDSAWREHSDCSSR